MYAGDFLRIYCCVAEPYVDCSEDFLPQKLTHLAEMSKAVSVVSSNSSPSLFSPRGSACMKKNEHWILHRVPGVGAKNKSAPCSPVTADCRSSSFIRFFRHISLDSFMSGMRISVGVALREL